MSESVKPRPYRSAVRQEQARRTRQAILTAASQLFGEQGYAATTMAVRAAGTAQDKIRIYATAVTTVNTRLAPLHLVLRGAAASAPELALIRDETLAAWLADAWCRLFLA